MSLESTLDRVAQRLRVASSVVYLCGAGLSVPSGIRAYRSGPDAVWGEYVLEWGTRTKFLSDPAAWWKTFWLGAHAEVLRTDIAPNAGHRALVELMRRSPKDLVVTQNIDGLHRVAGHPEKQLIEIHGRHDQFICASASDCPGVLEPVSHVDLSNLDSGAFPRCPHCQAPLRPLVLLFDEYYDGHDAFQAHRARRALNDADVIIFVGTSFSVGITSTAVRSAQVSGAAVVNVNLEAAPFPGVLELRAGAEVALPGLSSRLVG
ncbi:MAG: Sir2 family NAD-dependent protein deacetylase [Myxococcaceae bacterium]|nr:Sir2 family NAD-dependent protein deacetylase [Myxococcaceae bacterium]